MSSLQKANPCELFKSFVKKKTFGVNLVNLQYFLQKNGRPTGMIWVIKQWKCLSLLFFSISEWSAKLAIVSIY